jgi:hypothetical protein
MGTNTPRHEDNLNEVERRLSGWQPASGKLDGDAMLFAAGLAAGRRGRGRLLWPALSLLLAAQAAGLGAWGMTERAGRQALASRLGGRTPAAIEPGPVAIAILPDASPTLPPDGYLSRRRQMEQDPGLWLASQEPEGPQALGPPPPQSAILRAGQSEALLK